MCLPSRSLKMTVKRRKHSHPRKHNLGPQSLEQYLKHQFPMVLAAGARFYINYTTKGKKGPVICRIDCDKGIACYSHFPQTLAKLYERFKFFNTFEDAMKSGKKVCGRCEPGTSKKSRIGYALSTIDLLIKNPTMKLAECSKAAHLSECYLSKVLKEMLGQKFPKLKQVAGKVGKAAPPDPVRAVARFLGKENDLMNVKVETNDKHYDDISCIGYGSGDPTEDSFSYRSDESNSWDGSNCRDEFNSCDYTLNLDSQVDGYKVPSDNDIFSFVPELPSSQDQEVEWLMDELVQQWSNTSLIAV